MSHVRTHRVVCNGRPAGVPCTAEQAWPNTIPVRVADWLMREKGWRVHREEQRHICPSCWKRGQR